MKTHRACLQCGFQVLRERDKTIDYPFYCPHCYENKYRFETVNIKRIRRDKNKRG